MKITQGWHIQACRAEQSDTRTQNRCVAVGCDYHMCKTQSTERRRTDDTQRAFDLVSCGLMACTLSLTPNARHRHMQSAHTTEVEGFGGGWAAEVAAEEKVAGEADAAGAAGAARGGGNKCAATLRVDG